MASAVTVPPCLFAALPVVHPPHLEGNTALATEILPGPPSIASIRHPQKRADPKKPTLPLSYLPLSDPGTTYSGLAGGISAMAFDSGDARRKRARLNKGLSNRAQRASTRNLGQSMPIECVDLSIQADPMYSQTSTADMDSSTVQDEENLTSNSRSTSSQLAGETSNPGHVGKSSKRNGRDKGKEKADKEKNDVRVKEEPVAFQLSEALTSLPNEDHCSSCTSVGALLYCDGCPRAFHLWCLDPPMDPAEFVDGEDRWYCPGCKSSQYHPPSKPSSDFLSPLLTQLQSSIPYEFRLPEDIRNYFRDVGTAPGGAYSDLSSIKPNRLGRHGLGEERDPHRLRDHKGAPILCFRCGKSALPDDTEVGSSTKKSRQPPSTSCTGWRSMMSCDFCPLSWHTDCLDPPLTTLPPFSKKWKCPNHASNSTPRRRVPKSSLSPMEIDRPRQPNNGNIEVINCEPPVQTQGRIAVDEVHINGRRYRVPERVIILDFWSRLGQHRYGSPKQYSSDISSPLTSLSSLADIDEASNLRNKHKRPHDAIDDTVEVAELLCSLQSSTTHSPYSGHFQRQVVDKSTQTDQALSICIEREDVEHPTEVIKTPFKQMVPSHGKAPKGHSSIRASRSLTSSKSKKVVDNGKTAMNGGHDFSNSSSYVPSTDSSVPNNKHANGLENKLPTSIASPIRKPVTTTDLTDSKPVGSPFKIRIPGRSQPKAPILTDNLAPKASRAHSPRTQTLRRSSRRNTSVRFSGSLDTSLATGFKPSPKKHSLDDT